MGSTLFTNVQVIDGSGAASFAAEVLVEGNRIKQIARDGAALPQDGATVIDGAGRTLMPGLIESHAHISFCDTPDLEGLGDIPPEEHTLKTMKYALKDARSGLHGALQRGSRQGAGSTW